MGTGKSAVPPVRGLQGRQSETHPFLFGQLFPRLLLAGLAPLLVAGGLRLRAQSQAPPMFEVAAIKPSAPASINQFIHFDKGRLTVRGMSLKAIIQFAYGRVGMGLPSDLVKGGPKWYSDNRYDIDAKPEGNPIQSEQRGREMLKALLADRFNLRFHYESQATSGYVLVVGRNGPKMKERKPGDGGEPHHIGLRGRMLVPCRDTSMAELASFLEFIVGHPVLDGTDLPGTFDFDLNWRPDERQAGAESVSGREDPELPDLFTAITEQLGLRLQTDKVPAQVLVIEHVDKPSAN
ncbi:MAG: TIGR03435 family protein [Terriglobia bacterium]